MENNIEITHYAHYNTEDFLLDDFFTSSMNNPTEESERFWQDFLQLPGINPTHFLEAKRNVSALLDNYHTSFTPESVDELWEKIEKTHKENELFAIRKKRFGLLMGASIAAAVALLCVFLLPDFNSKNKNEDSIVAFVENGIQEIQADTAIRLLVSGSDVLRSNKKEAIIRYDSTEIKMEDEGVEKAKASKFNQLIVPHGKRSQLLLADGTQIWVNAGTVLTYPVEFDIDQREIYVNGEIFLNVAKDASRPFIVHTQDINISVLGTSFNVTSYDTETIKRVVLVSGSVQISNKTAKNFLLKPNDKYENKANSERVVQTDVQKYISWKDGIYEFESEPLGRVVKNISRYFGKQISCDANVQSLKCSGKLLIVDDLEKSLKQLTQVLPIIIKKENDTFYITKRDEK